MRKIVVTEYVTLDGVMDEPGKWSFPFFNEAAGKFKYDELFASDILLLGRITYEGFAAAWPTMEGTGDFGERMNGLPKFVVSTTLEKAEWNNSTIIKENVIEEIAKLKAQDGLDILVGGSGQLVRTLMEHNLVDEYRFMIHPLTLGGGKKLFLDGMDKRVLKLVDTKVFDTGIVILTYHPVQSE